MKLKVLTALLIISTGCFGQDIVINGTTGNRPLVWDDFTGSPDKSSSFEANTYWHINYKYLGITFSGDTVKFTGLNIKLELDPKLSWRKKAFETAELLKHEQGHFDIGIICQKALISNIAKTVFLKNNYNQLLKDVFANTMKKYHETGLQYDAETDHSKNKKAQEQWNEFFKKQLESK